MKIRDAIKFLKKPLEQAYNDYVEAAPHKFDREVSIRHPDTDALFHMRDDGVVSISSGKSCIILDGESGDIILQGARILSSAGSNNFFNKDSGFTIDGAALDPFWYSLDDAAAVVLPISTESLYEPYFLAGMPGAAVPRPLSDLLTKRSIFKSTKSTEGLVNKLSKLLR